MLGKLFDIHPAFVPLDLQTARTGNWISLKNYHGVTFVVIKGAGTAGDDPTFTVQQAQAVAGTNAKDLDGVSAIYTKEHATTLPGTWTKTTQTADAAVPGDGTSAEDLAVYAFEIRADQLDIANGFDCVNVSCGDVGTNAQLGCAFYVLWPKYQAAPENLLSPIAD